MAATAVRPRLSARAKADMTPEQELEYLIAEQAADDTYRLDPRGGDISLDAAADAIGYDPWDLVDAAIDLGLEPAEVAYAGELVNTLRPRRGDILVDPSKTPHGTHNAYRNYKCRCPKCRAAWAAYVRERRAAQRLAA